MEELKTRFPAGLDYSIQYDPTVSVPLAYLGRGRYRSVCDVPEPLQAIVVRTDALGERLSIAGFRVARLGPLARLRLLGGRALELLRRDPRALFAAFRRYRAGVVRGDVIVSRRGADTRIVQIKVLPVAPLLGEAIKRTNPSSVKVCWSRPNCAPIDMANIAVCMLCRPG